MTKTARWTTLILMAICLICSTVLGVICAKMFAEANVGQEATSKELEQNSDPAEMINILVIGVDKDGTRSDTIMLFSYDGHSDRISVLSFPRDTKVAIDGWHSQKLNAAIGIGMAKAKAGKDDAPESELIRQVKQLSGLPVHYYFQIDFEGFKEIIDVLGGVDFDVPYNMNYDDPEQDLHIHLQKGPQHLDGQMAHDFVRFRQNNGGTAPGEYVRGDEGRIYWQQQFLKAMVQQKLKPEYISRIDELLKVIMANVTSNCTGEDLLKLTPILEKLNPESLSSYQLPGLAGYEDGVSWYFQDKEATKKLIRDVFLPRSREQWEAEQAERATAEQEAAEQVEVTEEGTVTEQE